MKPIPLGLAAAALATSAAAQETREMDAHVHGVSVLQVAVEHEVVEINLTSPGMDIVGFEYAAETATDRAAIAAGVIQLSKVDEIITLSPKAGCALTEVLSHIHGDAHEHEDEEGHEEHDHEEHDDHAEGEEHEEQGRHSEFHARYKFVCENTEALTEIGLPFFDKFDHAEEIEAEYITETGAGAAEIERRTAALKLD